MVSVSKIIKASMKLYMLYMCFYFLTDIFFTDFLARYQLAGEECAQNFSAAIFSDDGETYQCETLLERGSCLREYEWRILTNRPDFKLWPECTRRCDRKNPYKVPFQDLNGPCVLIGDSDVCENPDEVVIPTFYGYGECGAKVGNEDVLDQIQNFNPEKELDEFHTGVVRKNCVTNSRGECVKTVEIVKQKILVWDE